MRTAVCLFTRDLRTHDNPTLCTAAELAEQVVPLFVLDDALPAPAARRAFLHEALAGLDTALRGLGGRLVVRRGDVVRETARLVAETGAEAVVAARDVTPYARGRERSLATAVPLRLVDTHFVVPPGELAPAGRDHYRVFSPFHRVWALTPHGDPLPPPRAVRVPEGVEGEPVPGSGRGGEQEGRARMERWLAEGLAAYGTGLETGSRLSAHLHLGCVSARELAVRASAAGGGAFVRQLCWRDFFAQLLLANPGTATEDLRPRGDRWVDDPDALAAWREGRTGYPLVDAGMRQLAAEGWLPNRVRLVTASFLVKHLGIDWREGVRHYARLLVDGDVAQNVGNWQWMAGVGADTRPNRILNPSAQGRRLDPDGEYVWRWVPELADVPARRLFQPGPVARGYPGPLVDHAGAAAAFRARRTLR